MEYGNGDRGEPGTVTGFIYGVETCGGVDGPGIRYVLFLQGCPLRCQYCHNPDAAAPGCRALKDQAGVRHQSVSQTVAAIRPYAPWLTRGGGITISGGEPLFQPHFTGALISVLKQQGYHVAVDTSGCAPLEEALQALDQVDLVLLDIKSIRPETYRRVTDGDVKPTLELAEALSKRGTPIWLRYVLVPGLTDDIEEIGEIAAFASSLRTVERVDVLPFHQLGKEKWQRLEREYVLVDTPEPSAEMVKITQEVFFRAGLEVT